MFGHDRPRPKEFQNKTDGWLHQPGTQEVPREGGAWLDPWRMPGGSTRGRAFRKGKRKRDIYQTGVQLLESTGNLSTSHLEQAIMVGRAPLARKSDTGVDQGKSLTYTSRNTRGLDKTVSQVLSSPRAAFSP